MYTEDEAFEAWIESWDHDANGRMADIHVAREAWAANKLLEGE